MIFNYLRKIETPDWKYLKPDVIHQKRAGFLMQIRMIQLFRKHKSETKQELRFFLRTQ
jgi:hypothetical protein